MGSSARTRADEVNGGIPLMPTPTARQAVAGPCDEWTGPRDKNGYGWQQFQGKLHRAHRVAYAEANGLTMSDIRGVIVRHRCDNPPCRRPDHLVAGTIADNNRDTAERGRHVNQKKTRCPKCDGEYQLGLDGKRECPTCRLARKRDRYERDEGSDGSTAVRARVAVYYQTHREEILAKQRRARADKRTPEAMKRTEKGNS